MMRPIPLARSILVFEVASLLGMPLILLGIRRIPQLKSVAKIWGGVLILGILLQTLAIGYERTYTFPMRWTLEVPDEIRAQVQPDPRFPAETAVIFSRPPLTDNSPGKHFCYQVMFSDELPKRLQQMHRDVVDVEYDVVFRFDTPIWYRSPRLKGDDRNTTIGRMGYMSQGRGTSGYTCFPGPGLFE
jgi:hypothetical protein